ncbi:hypothetical protein TNCV_4103891 [Trichonephila clavipes]|nr:hypothetical protein TNCV_4103891 [Trichonephila clavipes]
MTTPPQRCQRSSLVVKVIDSWSRRVTGSLRSFDVRCRQHPPVHTRSTCSFNQWGPKSCGLSHECSDWRIFPPSVHAEVVKVEIGGVAIYRPFGNFAQLNRTVSCMVLKANDRRSSSPLATMNFVGLDLTTSDR